MIRSAGRLTSIRTLNNRQFSNSIIKLATNINTDANTKTYKSHIKTKLDYFIETGQILKYTPEQYEKRARKNNQRVAVKSNYGSYSPQKALLVLKSKYDNILQSETGEIISAEKLTASDLNIDSDKSLQIFKALVNIKRINRKSLDEKLVLKLLGTNSVQLKDPFLVTRDVLKLLERDREITRAIYLAKIAGPHAGVVGMNAVLQWLLERGEIKSALKNFQDRKKWGIPLTEHTYTIFFDGLAKSHEWGKVPNDVAEKCIQVFENFREASNSKKSSESEEHYTPNSKKNTKCTIVHFNACLSLLMKNFKNDQQYAWSFFDLLIPDTTTGNTALFPNSQTFTIFLNGIKRYSQHKADLVSSDRSLSKQIKTLSLHQIQGKLAQTANLILEKIIAAAMPPVPPTKEEVEQNPDLLVSYRLKIKRQLVDIDQTFVSVFVSCLINNSAGTGTGTDLTSGSHYKYVQRGLNYLTIWCPEVESLLHFVEKASKDSTLAIIKPDSSLKVSTDSRIKDALNTCQKSDIQFLDEDETMNDILPQNVVPSEPLERAKLNPSVLFPPPLLSRNKTKAIFSNKQKRLVDFTRPTSSEVRAVFLDKQYKDSRGKFGKKLPATSNITLDKKNGINKFILMLTLDGLLQLGKFKEFYLSVWYCLTKWGGVYVSRTDILKVAHDNGIAGGVLSENYFPSYINSKDERAKASSSDDTLEFSDIPMVKKLDLTSEHEPEIVDIMLVENFIYKINENYKKESPSRLATEIFASLVNAETNISKTLKPRPKTIDAIFSVFMKELHHYNDSNYNKGLIEKRQKNIPNNTPKKSITESQLLVFMPSFVRFMDSLVVHESQTQRKKSLIHNDYVESFNRIVERIYNTSWVGLEKVGEINYHKSIIKSGILHYRPKVLIDKREKTVYTEPILESMEIVYEYLKNTDSLEKKDVKLMLSLRLIFQLRSNDEAALDKLESLSKNCYSSI